MEKYANTFYPGDKVIRSGDQKTASAPGNILEYSSTTEMFKVAFPTETIWVSAADMTKTA